MKRLFSVLSIVIMTSLLMSCHGKEEPLFASEPVEMYSPEKHGFDSGIYDTLALDAVTVIFEERVIDPSSPDPGMFVTGEHSYTYTDLVPGDRSFDPVQDSYLLTFYSFGGWTYFDRYGFPVSDGVSYYIPKGANASRIDAVLDKEFDGRATLMQELCNGTYGVQIEKLLQDGGRAYYFAHPDGYLFTPADPSEYADNTVEFLDMAALPSGLKYTEISEEEFTLLAALSVLYSGRDMVGQTVAFRAEDGLMPSEYSEYCMCISSSSSHLDLSYTQALEFLARYLKWEKGKTRITDTLTNPKDRETYKDLIKITEYRGQNIETCWYLTPSGTLISIGNDRSIGSGKLFPDSNDYKSVRVKCLTIWSAGTKLDYDAVKTLLNAYS